MKYWALWMLLCAPLAARVPLDHSRARPLQSWKAQIREYSRKHYGEAEWRLEPRCIVLHYTAGRDFPWNLVRSQDFAGEQPGLASHFVVQGKTVYQLLPANVRSRAAYGINHRAINIEMVANDEQDLMNRRSTMDTAADLVLDLLGDHQLSADEIYSHEQVARMNRKVCPWVLDLVNAEPYHKIDPGAGPMKYILGRVRKKL